MIREGESGARWVCPACSWVGQRAWLDDDEFVMRCPHCGNGIDYRLRDMIEKYD